MNYMPLIAFKSFVSFLTIAFSVHAGSVAITVVFAGLHAAGLSSPAGLTGAHSVEATSVKRTHFEARPFITSRAGPSLVADHCVIRKDLAVDYIPFSAVSCFPAFVTQTSSFDASSMPVAVVHTGPLGAVFPSESFFAEA